MRTLLQSILIPLCVLLTPGIAISQSPDLGAAAPFALFTAVGAFDNLGTTIVTGDIGTDVGAFTGFPPGIVIGDIHVADMISAQAAVDVDDAYAFLDGLTCGTVLGSTLGNNQILTPDIYCIGEASTLNATLILDAEGNTNAIFIFQIDGALSTSTFSNVVLINGASLCNVYWQINGAFALGDSSTFQGTILANGAISLLEASSLFGRGLSRSGAIDLHNNVVTIGLPPEAPLISADGPITFCEGDSVILSGNVDGTWSNGSLSASITVFADGEFYVVNTNSCGSDTSNHIIVTVLPSDSLSISCPADVTIDCITSTSPAQTGLATASANCGQAVTIDFSDSSIGGSCPQEFTIIRTWIASDESGNTTTCDQLISIEDNTSPLITCPPDVTLSCSDLTSPAVNGSATATENCDAMAVISFTDTQEPGGCLDDFSILRLWTASDECGNESTCIQTLTIQNNLPPTITCPANLTFSCAAELPLPDVSLILASGNCGGTTTVSFISDITTDQSCDNSFTITRTYQATDACGNTANCTQVITIDDETPPVILFNDALLSGMSNGETLSVQCFGQNPDWDVPGFDESSITVIDDCGSTMDVAFVQALENEGNCEEDGYIILYRLTWTATDDCDNSSSAYVFLALTDTIPPVIHGVPADITVSCNAVPETLDSVYATDECLCACVMLTAQTNLLPGCQEGQIMVRTWSSKDACGNETIVQQRITFEDNINPPMLIIQPGMQDMTDGMIMEFTCNEGGIPQHFDMLDENSVTNPVSCGGTSTITFESDIVIPNNCESAGFAEQRTYHWESSDLCGNTSDFTIVVRLIDNEAPALIGVPEFTCIGDPLLKEIDAIDNCGQASVRFWDVNISNPCGSGMAVRRTYEANDGCGNLSVDTVTLIPNDQILPVIMFTNPILMDLQDDEILVLNCIGQQQKFTSFDVNDVSVEDACLSGTTVSFTEKLIESGDCSGNGILAKVELTWIGSDMCGNTVTIGVIAHIIDNSAPVFMNFDSEVSINCKEAMPEIDAIDNCGQVTMTSTENVIPSVCPLEYDVQRMITLTDPCGNTTTRLQIIHVGDGQGPVITGAEENICDDLTLPDVKAFDECAGEFVEVSLQEDTIDVPCRDGMVIRRTWSAVGICGHTTVVTQTVTINDQTPPELLVPTNSVIRSFMDQMLNKIYLTQDDILAKLAALGSESVSAIDGCDQDITIVFNVDTTFSDNCLEDGFFERRVYNWIATDDCGNSNFISFTIDIIDDVPPVFTEVPKDITIVCVPLPLATHLTAHDSAGPVVITFEETMIAGINPGEFIITRRWTATDACGNVTVTIQTITWIPDTISECTIILPEIVECNTHGVLISSDFTGGLTPLTYLWEIDGEKCFIQSGQGTPDIFIYIGWTEVKIILTITDTFGCVSMCMAFLNCMDSVLLPLSISQTSDPFEVNSIEVAIPDVTPGNHLGEDLAQISVWPNPVNDHLNISFESFTTGVIELSLIDFLGKVISEDKLNTRSGFNAHQMDVSQIQPATYLLQMRNEKDIYTRLIVIVR